MPVSNPNTKNQDAKYFAGKIRIVAIYLLVFTLLGSGTYIHLKQFRVSFLFLFLACFQILTFYFVSKIEKL